MKSEELAHCFSGVSGLLRRGYCHRTAWPREALSPRADERCGVVPDCAVSVGYVAYALQSGSIHWSALWRFTTLERDDRPVAYWLAVGFFFFYGVLLIVLGVKR